MRAPYRVALLGFNAFERNILASHLRLAARRSPSYELHKILAEADFVVADADHAPSVELVLVTERLADAVFVGTRAPQELRACLPRPLEPLLVLRALDALAAAAAAAAPDAAGDKVRTAILPRRPGLPPAPPASDDEAPPPLELVLRSSVGPSSLVPPIDPPTIDLPLVDVPLVDVPLVEAPLVEAPLVETPLVETPLVEAPQIEMPPSAALAAEAPPTRVPPGASPSAAAPAAQPVVPRPPLPVAPAATLPRALVVDDSDIAQRFLQLRLAAHGLAADCVATSQQALDRLLQRSYELVFVDLELGPASPYDGLALCQKIKRDFGTRVPPPQVMVVTAHHGELDRVRAMLAGSDGFLGKPLDEAELERLLAHQGLARPRGRVTERGSG